MGATALTMAAVAIIACSKEKTAQQETPAPQQQSVDPNDLTLADIAETLSWEEGKAFFENQAIKDYTYVCEMVLNDCEFTEKSLPDALYDIVWRWPTQDGGCNSVCPSICKVVTKDTLSTQTNARGIFEDGKLVIIPTSEENGFTADGFLAVGLPVEVQNDSIVIREGIYSVYYDEELGRYVAVAVDFDVTH